MVSVLHDSGGLFPIHSLAPQFFLYPQGYRTARRRCHICRIFQRLLPVVQLETFDDCTRSGRASRCGSTRFLNRDFDCTCSALISDGSLNWSFICLYQRKVQCTCPHQQFFETSMRPQRDSQENERRGHGSACKCQPTEDTGTR